MNTTARGRNIDGAAPRPAADANRAKASPICLDSDCLESSSLYSTCVTLPHGDMLAVADNQHLLLLAYTKRHRFDEQLERLLQQLSVDKLTELKSQADLPMPLKQIRQELRAYMGGELKRFETPFRLLGTEFQKAVWQKLGEIPHGETRSYAELAASLGRPTASRAVARANATNRLSIIVPCHRVIASDGSLAGYAGGVDRKQRLLELEGSFKTERRLFD